MKKVVLLVLIVMLVGVGVWLVNDDLTRKQEQKDMRDAYTLMRKQIETTTDAMSENLNLKTMTEQENGFFASLATFKEKTRTRESALQQQLIGQLEEAHEHLKTIQDALEAMPAPETDQEYVISAQENIRSLTTTGKFSERSLREMKEVSRLSHKIREEFEAFRSVCSDAQPELSAH